MNAGTFLYYTMQSNIFAIGTAIVVLLCEVRRLKGKPFPIGVQYLRLLSAIAITLTFLVFSLMLTPQMIMEGNAWYLLSPGNFFVHNLVPIGAILDWCLFGSAKNLKKISGCSGMIPALAYVLFVYLCVALGIRFGFNKVPYFFLDYEAFGWFRIGVGGIGVFYWIAILGIVLAIVGYLFLAIAKKRERRQSMKNK